MVLRRGAAPESATIEQISIRKLFGYLNYEIESPLVGDTELSRALILYGDNGSGKTTILRAIYSMLSGEPNRGHRTRLGAIPFQEIRITFGDGRTVAVARPDSDGSTGGGYQFTVADQAGKPHVATWSPDFRADRYETVVSSDGMVHHVAPDGPRARGGKARQGAEFDSAIDALSNIVPESVYFLRDDRTIGSDDLPTEDDIEEYRQRRYMETGRVPEADLRTVALENALRRAHIWVRESTLRASEIGGQNTNQIYIDVASRIASPSLIDDPSASTSAAEMRRRLIRLGQRNEGFARLGLVPPAPSNELVGALEAVPDNRLEAILSVLVPFADALEAQLDVLEGLRFALSTFLEQTEGFLSNKSVAFSVRNGIQVISNSGEPLSPGQLSSGERQLLVLLTTVLATRDRAAIYLIDEPELSLNMKWQRRLVDSLLSCSGGSAASFIMASHSFELMAAARERVVPLTSG